MKNDMGGGGEDKIPNTKSTRYVDEPSKMVNNWFDPKFSCISQTKNTKVPLRFFNKDFKNVSLILGICAALELGDPA